MKTTILQTGHNVAQRESMMSQLLRVVMIGVFAFMCSFGGIILGGAVLLPHVNIQCGSAAAETQPIAVFASNMRKLLFASAPDMTTRDNPSGGSSPDSVDTAVATNGNQGGANGPPKGNQGGARSNGRGQVGSTGLWEQGTSSLISASLVGKNLVALTKYDPERRRLRVDKRGLQTVETASVESGVCADSVEAALATGDYSGSVSTSEGVTTYMYSGSTVSYSSADGGTSFTATVAPSDGSDTYYDVSKADEDSDCVVAEPVRRRLSELVLTDHDHALLRNRRKLASLITNTTGVPEPAHNRHPLAMFPGQCFIYHCFEGDADCPEPAPEHACLLRGPNGCEQPLCKWITESQMERAEDPASGAVARVMRIQHERARKLGAENGRRLDHGNEFECTDFFGKDSNGKCDVLYYGSESYEDHGTCDEGVCTDCFSANTTVCFVADASCTAEQAYDQCFGGAKPTTAHSARMDSLQQGDKILAVDSAGLASIDQVAFNSLAEPGAYQADYLELATRAGRVLTVTAGHHLPTGTACCSEVKTAAELVPGDLVYVMAEGRGAISDVVSSIKAVVADGRFSPWLVHGGYPIVDGFVTSPGPTTAMQRQAVAMPFVEPLCKWMGGLCAAVMHFAECAVNNFNGQLPVLSACPPRSYISAPAPTRFAS